MLFSPAPCSFGFTYDNWGANPSTSSGILVAPGASNAEGAWNSIATGTDIAQDVYFAVFYISSGSTSATAKNQLLDIGVDPSGSTSYTAVVSNFVCGSSSSAAFTARPLIFPLFIKAGSRVGVRLQGSAATAGTVRVQAKFYGQPSRPELFPVCTVSETIGAITNSNGVSFTPGNAADGTWVSLGTLSRPAKWVQLGCQIDNATMSAHQTYVDLGVGDSTNKRVLIRTQISMATTETILDTAPGNLNFLDCQVDLPTGAELWIRGRNSAAPVTGYNGNAIAFG